MSIGSVHIGMRSGARGGFGSLIRLAATRHLAVPALLAGALSLVPAARAGDSTGTGLAGISLAEGHEDHRLELGGLVTLDHTSGLNAAENPDLSLSQVALGANVTLSKEVLASVLLMAEGDMGAIFFDQAMASLHPDGSPWTLLFGQQTLNHGLLSTRLISDPEILPAVELSLPGVTAAYAWNASAAGVGIAVLQTDIEGYVSKDYALIPNLDLTYGPLLVRASGIASRYRADADAALSLTLGPVQLDAEGFADLEVLDAQSRNSGYYLGAELAINPLVSIAVRQDGLASDGFSGWQVFRYGAGLTLNLKHDLFAACEYGYRDESGAEGDNRIALQIGLKSTLELPGFQRKTLTQD